LTEHTVTITAELAGRRLDVLVSSTINLSRTKAKSLVEGGFVFIDNVKVTKPSLKVRCGQKLLVKVPEEEPVRALPQKIPVDVIYEDEDIVVLNKPPGLVVHPAPGHHSGTLVNALLYRYREIGKVGDPVRPGIVHRLDRDTAGVMVVTKNERAMHALSRQFKDRKVEKIYRALVLGVPAVSGGTVSVPIGRDVFNRKKISPRTASPREAITHYRVLKVFKEHEVAELECKPETGRTHQIRVHMSVLGYPILGDRTYGYKPSKLKDEKLKGLVEKMGMHALCAFRITFRHPRTGKLMSFEAELPEGYKNVLAYLEGA